MRKSSVAIAAAGIEEVYSGGERGIYRGQQVRIKRLAFSRRVTNVDVGPPLRRELKAMRSLHNENVVMFMGASMQGSNIFLVWEYATKGVLSVSVLKDHRFWANWNVFVFVTRRISWKTKRFDSTRILLLRSSSTSSRA